MPSKRVNITVDGTARLLVTPNNRATVTVYVTSGSTLGGGTLSISVRELNGDGALIPIDTPVAAGAQQEYVIGTDMELHYDLTGATSPNIDLLAAVAE